MTAFDEGFNFRSTLAFVTDPTDTQFVDGIHTYPTTANGVTFGWESGFTAANERNRSAAVDARLAGVHFSANTGTTPAVFRVDLVQTGDHNVYIALGDANSAAQVQTCVLKDNTTTFATVATNAATLLHHFIDATGVDRTSEADWVTNNVFVLRTFASMILRVNIGGGSGLSNSSIAHLRVVFVGAGGGSFKPYWMLGNNMLINGVG